MPRLGPAEGNVTGAVGPVGGAPAFKRGRHHHPGGGQLELGQLRDRRRGTQVFAAGQHSGQLSAFLVAQRRLGPAPTPP